jgi:hypothetical protein
MAGDGGRHRDGRQGGLGVHGDGRPGRGVLNAYTHARWLVPNGVVLLGVYTGVYLVSRREPGRTGVFLFNLSIAGLLAVASLAARLGPAYVHAAYGIALGLYIAIGGRWLLRHVRDRSRP